MRYIIQSNGRKISEDAMHILRTCLLSYDLTLMFYHSFHIHRINMFKLKYLPKERFINHWRQ